MVTSIICAVIWGICFILWTIMVFRAVERGEYTKAFFRELFMLLTGAVCVMYVADICCGSKPQMKEIKTKSVQIDTVYTTTNGVTDTTYVVNYLQ